MPPRGRPKKGGEVGPKTMEESSNAFQALADLEELGYSKDEVVKLLNQVRENGKAKEVEHTMKPVAVSVKTPLPQIRKSLADLAEEEENEMGAANVRRSWADIARANRDPNNGMRLSYVKPTEVLSFSAAELCEGASLWNSALIGMVEGASPSYIEVVKYSRNAWKDVGVARVHQLRKGIFLFDFNGEEDKAKILDGRWAVYNRFPLILKPWRSGMDINKCFDKLPIWVQFPGLNLDLWTTRNLSRVASYVGVPIISDACTAVRDRLTYARVLVEVPLNGKLPDNIPMDCDGEKFLQQVIYEWKPVRCGHCGWLGHDAPNCRRNKGAGGTKKPEQTVESNSKGEEISDVEKIVEEEVQQNKQVDAPVPAKEQASSSETNRQQGKGNQVTGNIGNGGRQNKPQTNQGNQVIVNKTPILQNLALDANVNKKGNQGGGKGVGKKGSPSVPPNG